METNLDKTYSYPIETVSTFWSHDSGDCAQFSKYEYVVEEIFEIILLSQAWLTTHKNTADVVQSFC